MVFPIGGCNHVSGVIIAVMLPSSVGLFNLHNPAPGIQSITGFISFPIGGTGDVSQGIVGIALVSLSGS